MIVPCNTKGGYVFLTLMLFEKRILTKEHKLCYVVHLDLMKMHYHLKVMYWWNGMKRDMAKFLAKCMVC